MSLPCVVEQGSLLASTLLDQGGFVQNVEKEILFMTANLKVISAMLYSYFLQ